MVKRLTIGCLLALAACAPQYSLVQPASGVAVAKGGMHVTSGMSWNRAPRGPGQIAEEEDWTENGPLLDDLTFVAALPEGRAITRQKAKADQKVPTFQADMSPQDMTSMLETLHRIRGDVVFDSAGIVPRRFLGQPGLQYDYNFIGADNVPRRGRAAMVVADRHLYLIALEATASHYFDAALPEFERVANSASLR